MKTATLLQKMLWALCFPLLVTGCEDKMDEHYKIPDWVAGSEWEVLSSGEHGNYSIFLEGADIAGFTNMLKGRSIMTVMAPDDEAFQTYLSEKGYASIKDMPVEEVKKLIGFHLMDYSYTKDMLVNFRPEGTSLGDDNSQTTDLDAGLYYKHRTRSQDEPTWETNPATNEDVLVYHRQRFLPVFSYQYFQTRKIDAQTNYEYFYPNSTWTGADGFNVSNASVKEYGIIANNGYIYTLDRVLEPLETIYTELEANPDFSTYVNLYNSFGSYTVNNELTTDYAASYGVDEIYQHTFTNVPNIANEWPTDSEYSFSLLCSAAYTIFAPTNEAIEDFFERFWKPGGYNSLDEVDKVALSEFIYNYIYAGDMLFPSDLQATGDDALLSSAGTPLNIDPYSVAEDRRIMCVNGALYGLDNIDTPASFSTVVGPIFKNKTSLSFLYALSGSGLFSNYVSDMGNYIMVIPTTDQFSDAGIYTVTSTQELEQDTEDGRVALTSSQKQDIMYMHSASLATGESNELPVTGSKVYPLQKSWNYWFVKDGKMTCSALFNLQLNPQNTVSDPFAAFHKTETTENGTVYSFDYNGIFTAESGDIVRDIAICADKNYIYHHFTQLLKQAGLISGEDLVPSYYGRFITFIPTNEAIEKAVAENRIPGFENGSFDADGNLTGTVTDTQALRDYMYSYFITLGDNGITSYPYVGSDMKSGTYYGHAENVKGLIYTDDGERLSVRLEGSDHECHVVDDYDQFPFAFEDCCFHMIDDVL